MAPGPVDSDHVVRHPRRIGTSGIYQVDGSTLSQKLIPLEDHRHAMTVRTMELPSGKVVLMAGGRVSFLDV